MNSPYEIERFFKAFSAEQRKYVERSSEYKKAVAAGDSIAALEIASVLLTNNLNWSEQDKLFRKKFPDYSD